MADNTDNMVLYTAVYGDVNSALDDLNALEQLENAPEYDPSVVLTAELVKRYLTVAAEQPA